MTWCVAGWALAGAVAVAAWWVRREMRARVARAEAEAARLRDEAAAAARRLARVEVLHAIAAAQGEGVAPDVLLAQVGRELGAAVGGARVCVWERGEGGAVVLASCLGAGDEAAGAVRAEGWGGAWGEALAAGEVCHATVQDTGGTRTWWAQRGARSWAEVGVVEESGLRASVSASWEAEDGCDDFALATMEDVGRALSRAVRAWGLEAERRVAVEKLLRSEACYRRIFDQSPDPMVLYDEASGRVLGMNAAAEALLGPARGDGVVLPVAEGVSTGEPARVRRRVRAADGREVEVTETSYAVEFVRPGARLATLHDVSALRRDEAEAARDEARARALHEAFAGALRLVAEAAPLERIFKTVCDAVEQAEPGVTCTVSVLTEDRTRLRLVYSGSLAPEMSMSAADLPVRDDFGVCPVAASTGRRVVSEDVQADPKCAVFADLALRCDIRSCWSEPLRGLDGRVMGTFALYRPVPGPPRAREIGMVEAASEIVALALRHHAALHALELTRRRHERALRATRAIVWEYDPRGDVSRMWGYPEGGGEDTADGEMERWEWGPSDWAARVHPEDVAEMRRRFDACLRGEGAYDAEYRLRLGDGGGYRWVRSMGVRVEESGGTRVVGTLVDVTDRRRALDELARSNGDLERFAGTASHELQEPLRTMRAYADLLVDRHGAGLGEEGRSHAGQIREASARMQALVEGLLTFARAGGRPVPGEVDLRVVAAEAAMAARAAVGARRGDVSAVEIGEMPRVRGDAVLLRQVLENLLVNALKFAPDGGGRVRVEARRAADAWEIRVADDGDGIAPADRERVFTMFTRLRPRSRGAGSGLGLAICRRIVEGHGGRIWVEGNEPRGSVFAFTIPDAGGCG
jgi:PAS domain S-box-containing protein